MKNNLRFVIDTNVLISYLLSEHSKPGQSSAKAFGMGQVLLSEETLLEIMNVLYRQKFDKYVPLVIRKRFIKKLMQRTHLIETSEKIIECRDRKDNKILEVAVSGQADCIISGDKDLLVLNPFRDIPILSPTDFLDWEPVLIQNLM